MKINKPFKLISLTVFGTLLLLVLISQIFATMSTTKTEQQPFKLILKEGDFEVRHYDEVLVATVNTSNKSYRGDANENFRKLAGFIFGNNQKKESIGMTAPVHMEKNDSGSTMSFVMPSRYSKNDLPKPNDPSVAIKTIPAGFYAIINFGGFAPESKILRKIEELKNWLKQKNYSIKGQPKYFGFNPPYELFGRHNEVVVEIDYK